MSIKYKGQTISGGSALPPGGTTDQVLTKASDADGDVMWKNAGGGGEVYSTEEIKIGTWIDGNPLYRRVIEGTTPGSSGSTNTIGVVSDYVKTVVHVYGFVKDKVGGTFPVGCIYSSTRVAVIVNKTGNLYCSAVDPGNEIYNRPICVIVEYTKSND